MRTRHGFTLVELSIVLVILGLLVGGVLTGQSLIRAAELRSISTQYAGFVTATQTFRDKYFAIPGDMTNAQSYWGIAAASNCATTTTNTTATCNGNGNGQINDSANGTSDSHEGFRFWQHLANAGLIEGTYTGILGGGGTINNSVAANSPKGRLSGSLWFAYNWGTMTGSASRFDGAYNNILTLGAPSTTDWPSLPFLKPDELYNIDTKMDDGKPATGKIVVNTNNALGSCADTSTPSALSANYLLSATTPTCSIVFRQQF